MTTTLETKLKLNDSAIYSLPILIIIIECIAQSDKPLTLHFLFTKLIDCRSNCDEEISREEFYL